MALAFAKNIYLYVLRTHIYMHTYIWKCVRYMRSTQDVWHHREVLKSQETPVRTAQRPKVGNMLASESDFKH